MGEIFCPKFSNPRYAGNTAVYNYIYHMYLFIPATPSGGGTSQT